MNESNSDVVAAITANEARKAVQAILAWGGKHANPLEMQMAVEFAINPNISYENFAKKYQHTHYTAEKLTKIFHDFIRHKFKPGLKQAHALEENELRKLSVTKNSIGQVLQTYKLPYPHQLRGDLVRNLSAEFETKIKCFISQASTEEQRKNFGELQDIHQKIIDCYSNTLSEERGLGG